MSIPERWRTPLAVGFAFLALIVVLLFLAIWRTSTGWGYDFSAYYDAANRLQATGTPYQVETLSGPFRPGPGGLYLYSPALAVSLLPMADVPFDMATVLWLAVRFVLFLATFALMPVSRNIRLAVFTLACVTPSALEDLNLGNISLVVTFLGVIAWRYLDKPVAGVAIGLSMLIRPTMAVIAGWWLLRRRFAPVIATVATVALAVLASLPFVGLGGWFDFVAVLRNLSSVTGVPRNFDMASLALHLGAPTWFVTATLFGAYAIAVAAVLFSLRRDREVGFVVSVGATLLLSPLLWNHYLTHTWIVSAFLAARGRWWGILLPLLTWLPQEMLGFTALATTLLPFLARDALPDAARSSERPRRAITATSVDSPAVQMTGDASVTAVGTTQRRSVRAPQTMNAAATGSRNRSGTGKSALGCIGSGGALAD
ncbi:MAG: glycosyltransferase family 87 protein [Candidatus Limnocylindrales bacterium]